MIEMPAGLCSLESLMLKYVQTYIDHLMRSHARTRVNLPRHLLPTYLGR